MFSFLGFPDLETGFMQGGVCELWGGGFFLLSAFRIWKQGRAGGGLPTCHLCSCLGFPDLETDYQSLNHDVHLKINFYMHIA